MKGKILSHLNIKTGSNNRLGHDINENRTAPKSGGKMGKVHSHLFQKAGKGDLLGHDINANRTRPLSHS